jgi:hypothetical protein
LRHCINDKELKMKSFAVLLMLLAVPVAQASSGDVVPIGISYIVSPADAPGLSIYKKAAAAGLPALDAPGAFVQVYSYTYFGKPMTPTYAYVPVALRAVSVPGSVTLVRDEPDGFLRKSAYPPMLVGLMFAAGSAGANDCVGRSSAGIVSCSEFMTAEQIAMGGRTFESFASSIR